MFVEIDHPVFAIEWLLRSLDETFQAAGSRLDRLTFGIEGSRDLDDKHPFYSGSVSFEPGGGPGTGLSEDEKDHIPAVRRMERLVDDLRFVLPIPFDDEGRSGGDFLMEAKRGRVRFLSDSGDWEPDGCQILIESERVGDRWINRTQIRFGIDDQMSRTELAGGDGQSFLASLFTPSRHGIAMPVATGFAIEPSLSLIGDPDPEGRQIVVSIGHDSFARMENENVA